MKRAAILIAIAVDCALIPSIAVAHPMGNFSISHYTKLEATREKLVMVYALDLAEIPTFELLREWQLERTSSRTALEGKAREQAQSWLSALVLEVNGTRFVANLDSIDLAISDGAGNLPVMRISVRATVTSKPGRLVYEDLNYPDRAGWKEIVIASRAGARLTRASHTDKDISKALTEYPADPTFAPPQELRARMEWRADQGIRDASPIHPQIAPVEQLNLPMAPQASPAVHQSAPGTVQKGDVLSQLLSRQDLGFTAMLLAIAASFGFGAMHALSPGHGKTIVAAYLVGSRGTLRHAMFLGAMVTFVHTVSVFLLGLGTLFLSQYIVPGRIYPILGAISGLTIVGIGASLFYKRLLKLVTGDQAHSHLHHHDHDHHHGRGGHSHVPEGDVTFASLTGLAVSGGLVPCPSALVLLLSAIALGRVGFGLLLLTSFSLGLSLVLIAIGCIVLYAKHLLPDTPRVQRSPFFVMMPVISAAVVTCVGLFMTLVALGVLKTSFGI